MLRLHVNIDHVATLREARYRHASPRSALTPEPDPVAAARLCEAAGAHGITVHLREDRRHIQDRDVYRLRAAIRTCLNLEMAATTEITAIACDVHPDITCIVPEKRTEVTTEGGLDVVRNRRTIATVINKLHNHRILVSLFIPPDQRQLCASAEVGADFVELHTGAYANARGVAGQRELNKLIRGAELAATLGLRVNAGHGITYENFSGIKRIPHLVELNIGHSIISRAVLAGLAPAVSEMLTVMRSYEKGQG